MSNTKVICESSEVNVEASSDVEDGHAVLGQSSYCADEDVQVQGSVEDRDSQDHDLCTSDAAPINLEGKPGVTVPNGKWDAKCNELPREDAMPDPDSQPEPSEEKAEFLPNSFRELHYFYNYVRRTLEDGCQEYARRIHGDQIVDRTWTWLRLYDPGHPKNEFGRIQMVDREWNEPGQTELDDWDYFFGKIRSFDCFEEERVRVFRYVNYLRQAAVHRRHNELSKPSLEKAMKLPALLRDYRRSNEVWRMYKILLQDPATRSQEDKQFFERLIYIQDDKPVLIPQLLGQFQYLAEYSAFAHAQITDPEWLQECCATVPEQIELQEYDDRWEYRYDEKPDDHMKKDWKYNLKRARDLRNEATHRGQFTDPEISNEFTLTKRVKWAKNVVTMFGDPAQAEKIEKIANEWFATYRPGTEHAEIDEEGPTAVEESPASTTEADTRGGTVEEDES